MESLTKYYNKVKLFAQELNQQTKHGVVTYYTNWKFYKDIIRPKIMMGSSLTRPEIISMKTFKQDSLCFIPLFIYLAIPFSTFGLPLYIRHLSAILPSTFSTREMTSRDNIQPNHKITLSDLDRGDLVLLSKCIGFKFGFLSTASSLIQTITQWEKEISHDNKMILREGIQNLSIEDLQDISYVRGIHFAGKNYDQLLQQLSTSLILSPAAPTHSSCALAVLNSLISTNAPYTPPSTSSSSMADKQ
ncbi:hypothetical protein SAMD00019534_002120 [Acytostelium subglobosum LB1]|uniref:hypothetical protein n=1 Tax=Acytostelium subglobosum LB1 TaxID=1410327 RepID=UPI00064481C8|nr:hypothetical protein SAMD00019534_002120 [Acytostelium subglobosum LB1]GAM17037.1 hypothetical protein SAMD00019534_002120 [Acytostelium subglobosum LB1]|eukprot:XP_012759099.1 hypothetical protein SAMD00019534_002120 [Acytostelium subglobosum LB1]